MTRVDLSLCARVGDRRILSILRKTFRFLIDSDLAFRFFARTKPARAPSAVNRVRLVKLQSMIRNHLFLYAIN